MVVLNKLWKRQMIEYKVIGPKSKARKTVEALLPSMIKQLKLASTNWAICITVESGDKDNCGYTAPVPFLDRTLSIMVNSKQSTYQVAVTLAHELVHAKQIVSGKLVPGIAGVKATTWCGKKYRSNTPYLNQPWEVAAFSQQELLVRRALSE